MRQESMPWPEGNPVLHLAAAPHLDPAQTIPPDAWRLAVDNAVLSVGDPIDLAPDDLTQPLVDLDGQIYAVVLGDVLADRDPEDVQRTLHGALASAAAAALLMRRQIAVARRLLNVAETLTPEGVTR